MSLVIVPDYISEEIYRKVDAAIAAVPDSDRVAVSKERETFYRIVLGHFDQHGVIPEFSLTNLGRADNGGDKHG